MRIFLINAIDKGLISKTYKQFMQFKKKNTQTTQSKMGEIYKQTFF